MGFFSKIVWRCTKKVPVNNKDHKTNYIFYKIVGSSDNDVYTLQCINTSAVFYANILDIARDPTLLYGLHPVQACYLGMQYAHFLRSTEDALSSHAVKNKNKHQWFPSRYGQYHLTHQDRKGNIGFLNKETGETLLMSPRQIALSEILIKEFDAAQAFYIGLTAVFKSTLEKLLSNKRPFLFVVK